MSIEFPCTGCQKTLRVAALSAGKQARCPSCGAISLVPVAAGVGAASLPVSTTDSAGMSQFPAAPRSAEPVNPFSHSTPPKADTNPYVSPAAVSPFAPAAFAGHGNLPLATRGARFLGFLLDLLIYCLGFIPGVIIAAVMPLAGFDGDLAFGVFALSVLAGLLIMLGIAIYNWVLISQTGQSIAKRMLGIRIVRKETGEPPGFLHGVLLRAWVPWLINEACGVFYLVDACWIFGDEIRCLHDLIADTIVVDLRGEPGDVQSY